MLESYSIISSLYIIISIIYIIVFLDKMNHKYLYFIMGILYIVIAYLHYIHEKKQFDLIRINNRSHSTSKS